MPVIPHSISSDPHPTFGEKKLHRIFCDLYDASDDVYVWYEPPALASDNTRDNGKKYYTDFILFSQAFGILNLEVKDWKFGKIRADKTFWEIENDKGVTEKKESPIEQSRRCAYAIKDKLIKEQALVHADGEHKGKLQFPFGFGVVFTHIKKTDVQRLDGFNDLLPFNQVLFKEDLDFDVSNRDERLGFEKKLRNIFTQWFEFESLNFSKIKVLRKAIWPELVVKQPSLPLSISTIDQLKLLDIQQEDFAKTLGEGHHLIKGVAGSGKTLVLAYRAKYLHKLRKDWRILFVCYNKSLKNYVRKIFEHILDGEKTVNIDIRHFHELVTRKTGKSVAHLPGEDQENWDKRVGIMLRHAIMNNKIVGGKYDAIMIDEAQDFSTEWLNGIRELLGKSDVLTVALDPAQDIYGRRRVWKDAGIDIVGGRRSRKLKQSYRNTSEILLLAVKFRGLEDYLKTDDDSPDAILIPDEVERHGDKPNIVKFATEQDLFQHILLDISKLINSKNYSFNDISVISCDYDIAKELVEVLKKKKIPVSSLLLSKDRDAFDIDENSVKIITVESSKGLEWKVVFLLGVDQMPRSGREEKYENNLVYIGITRAQELLYINYLQETILVKKLIEINKNI
jgi:hypothetical protein